VASERHILAELLADGLHHGSSRYERGDRNLVSEKAIQLDIALELHFEHLGNNHQSLF
jgi:iron complex outermembrane recepter protein